VIELNWNRPVEQCLYARGRSYVSAYSNSCLEISITVTTSTQTKYKYMCSHYETTSPCCAVRLTKLDDMSSDVTSTSLLLNSTIILPTHALWILTGTRAPVLYFSCACSLWRINVAFLYAYQFLVFFCKVLSV
jgi:hypothetical protein